MRLEKTIKSYGWAGLLCGWALLLAIPLSAQELELSSVPVRRGGKLLPQAWLGGLNNPQVALADLDNDGRDDLYVFDRTGAVHLGFYRDPDSQSWTYRPELTAAFPPVEHWAHLTDFNGDGVVDLFAFSDTPGVPGVQVSRGVFREGRLEFERLRFDNLYDLLFFSVVGGNSSNLYVSPIDYPAIADADCDGDLDILTFDLGGVAIEFYQNQSVERGFGLDSLIFQRASTCWGGVTESEDSGALSLAAAPGACANGRSNRGGPRHSGSTLLLFDGNGDPLPDLLIGDISFSQLTFLQNGGTCGEAWLNAQEVGFPANDFGLDLPYFPVAFYGDENADGRPDLLAAPNALSGAEDVEVLWLYHDLAGGAQAPRFELQDRAFLTSGMIDLGTGAYPAFADVNGDGLIDLLVGHRSRYVAEGRQAGLHLFLNTGTPTQPAFELAGTDFLGMRQFNDRSFDFVPAFGDLDGDGDQDLVVGEISGQLFYAENTAGAGAPMQFANWEVNFARISVGQSSAPQIADLDGDGLADLIVGERNGNLNFFKNIGTMGNPDFNADPSAAPNLDFLGQVDTRRPNSSFFAGYSAPCLFRLEDGWHLLTGSQDSGLEHYTGLEGDLSQAFDLQLDGFGDLQAGYRTRPAVADLDGDGLLEMVVGNQRGGLSYYETGLGERVTSSTEAAYGRPAFRVFPNPARDRVQIIHSGSGGSGFQLELYDTNGKRLLARSVPAGSGSLELDGMPAGVYVLRLRSGRVWETQRLVIVPGN